jgi:uncharacterized protein YcaQ
MQKKMIRGKRWSAFEGKRGLLALRHDGAMPVLTMETLRRYAVRRSLFTPTSLPRAIERLGFLQLDPIRAPARAQDLVLRHRVKAYRAGDLEARYSQLDVEEDFFVNYGILPRATQALMHPRIPAKPWPAERFKQAEAVLDFIKVHGVVHPRQVDAHFDSGSVLNWFGGQSKASTHLLDDMHYRGWLRVARREAGIRLYAPRLAGPQETDAVLAQDRLVDVIVAKYAPLPAASLGQLLSLLAGGVPQWKGERARLLQRAGERLPHATVEGVRWFWPEGEDPTSRRHTVDGQLRLLAPFDPVVWDRRRFEIFWGWAYRFEAYTPPAKRVRGYYALPLLWRDQVIGWANLAQKNGRLQSDIGFVTERPREAGFEPALDAELQRMSDFLGL